MTSLWAGGKCEPCEDGLHEKCVGWKPAGFDFCGCAQGLCSLRLITGVMWTYLDNDQAEDG